MKYRFGHNVYGLAAIAYGVITLASHRINSLGNISHPGILIYLITAAEVIGGLLLQWQRTIKYGAIATGTVFFIFTLYLIPPIFKMPLAYFTWGNFFEEFSIVLGSVFIFAASIANDLEKQKKILRFAYVCYGICVISYSLYQLFYLPYTAGLVPKWIPPGQMFWAVITTVAFALAAVAIISGRSAQLASGLLTAMFIGFGLLVWSTRCIIHPHQLINWTSNATNLAVAASAWIVTDYLYSLKLSVLNQPQSKRQIAVKEEL